MGEQSAELQALGWKSEPPSQNEATKTCFIAETVSQHLHNPLSPPTTTDEHGLAMEVMTPLTLSDSAACHELVPTLQMLCDMGQEEDLLSLCKKLTEHCPAGKPLFDEAVLVRRWPRLGRSWRCRTTLFHVAAAEGWRDLIRLLIDSGARIDNEMIVSENTPSENTGNTITGITGNGIPSVTGITGNDGDDDESALLLAVRNRHADVAELLLENGACVNRKNKYGVNPLIVAASEGDENIVSKLIDKGAKVDETEHLGRTALWFASQYGHVQVVARLVEKGANITKKDDCGWSPFMVAVKGRHWNTVGLLLSYCATKENKNLADSAVGVAAEQNDLKMIKILLEHGASIDSTNKSGDTPVIIAILNGHEDLASWLIQRGANVEKCSENGTTPLLLACACDQKNIVRLLLEKGAEVDKQNDIDFSPMLIAAQHGCSSTIQLLLEHGADVNRANSVGFTPLIMASQQGHCDIVRILFARGAHISARCKDIAEDMTALMIAVCYKQFETARLLLSELGSYVDDRDRNGMTALMHAARKCFCEMVDLLLLNGSSSCLQDRRGRTALHWAALDVYDTKRGCRTLELLLRDCNDNVTELQDDYGLSAKTVAMERDKDLSGSSSRGGERGSRVGLSLADFMQSADTDAVRAAYRKRSIDFNGMKDRDNRNTLLHISSMLGNETMAHVLLYEIKMDVNCQNGDGKTALALAASQGHLHLVRRILAHSSVDVNAVDLNGQTALHLAASYNNWKVVKTLLECPQVSKLVRDNKGNTALHCACLALSVESFRELLNVDLFTANKDGWTPFHCLLGATSGPPDDCSHNLKQVKLLRCLISDPKYKIRVCEVDSRKRNLLHLAVEKRCIEIIPELSMLDPEQLNDSGQSPLHMAVKDNSSEVILKKITVVFYTSNQPRDIDHLTTDGESALLMSVKRGCVGRVRLLLDCGANLKRRCSNGITIMHQLADCVNVDEQIKLYHIILEYIVRWRFLRSEASRDVPPPEFTKHHDILRKDAMTALIFGTTYSGMNVVQYAAMKGAFDLLRTMVVTPGILAEATTDQLPLTTDPDEHPTVVRIQRKILAPAMSKYQHCYHCLKTSILNNNKEFNLYEHKQPVTKICCNTSVLQLVVDSSDKIGATEILNKEPFKGLIAPYWKTCQVMYMVMLAMHVLHMTVFSAVVLPLFNRSECHVDVKDTSSAQTHADTECRMFETWFWSLTVWPTINFLSDLLNLVQLAVHRTATENMTRVSLGNTYDVSDCREADVRSRVRSRQKVVILNELVCSLLFSLAFVVSTAVWVIASTGFIPHWYIESQALILLIGWLYTINFISVFEQFTTLVDVLKTVIFKDVSRICAIFIFILLSFSLSFHTLTLRKNFEENSTRSVWFTMYTLFFQTFGAETEYQHMSMEQQLSALDVVFFRFIFALYVFTASFVLLNLLIAMMNDTYAEAVKMAKKSAAVKKLWLLSRLINMEEVLYTFSPSRRHKTPHFKR